VPDLAPREPGSERVGRARWPAAANALVLGYVNIPEPAFDAAIHGLAGALAEARVR
jgi:hypothetical protein